MKNIFITICLLMAFGFRTGEYFSLSQQERKFAIDYLILTRDGFLKDVQNLSDSQLNFKASPEKWSVAQCIDHIAIAENALFAAIQKALLLPADSAKRAEITASDTTVLRVVTDRSHKSTAPEFLQPDGKFANTKEALESYKLRRSQTIEYISTTNDDLRNHFGKHPILGTIDGYQALLLIAAHSRRHTLQIEEVIANPDFPKQ